MYSVSPSSNEKEVIDFIYPTGRRNVCSGSHDCIHLIVSLRFSPGSSCVFLSSLPFFGSKHERERGLPLHSAGPQGSSLIPNIAVFVCVWQETGSVGSSEGFSHSFAETAERRVQIPDLAFLSYLIHSFFMTVYVLLTHMGIVLKHI